MTAIAPIADRLASLRDEAVILDRAIQDTRNTLWHADNDEVEIDAIGQLDELERKRRAVWSDIATADVA